MRFLILAVLTLGIAGTLVVGATSGKPRITNSRQWRQDYGANVPERQGGQATNAHSHDRPIPAEVDPKHSGRLFFAEPKSGDKCRPARAGPIGPVDGVQAWLACDRRPNLTLHFSQGGEPFFATVQREDGNQRSAGYAGWALWRRANAERIFGTGHVAEPQAC